MPLIPFSSQLIADVGISLGDEGKGRLIPEVADELLAFRAQVGAFGTLLYAGKDWTDPALARRSMVLLAEKVRPRLM